MQKYQKIYRSKSQINKSPEYNELLKNDLCSISDINEHHSTNSNCSESSLDDISGGQSQEELETS